MTKKLFWDNQYQKEFQAKVIKIDGKHVWLDQTCFYPESGGQAGDTGYLNNLEVIDTRYDNNKDVYHILKDEPSFQVEDTINGQINWERRYQIMKIHSASHIMEYFLLKNFGNLKLEGSHLNEKYDKSTYKSEEKLDSDKLIKVEKEANDLIAQKLPIETWEDPNRKNYRYWKTGEIQMPCGGTHVKNTSEIGSIALKRKTGGKGSERVITSLKN